MGLTIVTQRTMCDSAIAALAMFVNKNYENVEFDIKRLYAPMLPNGQFDAHHHYIPDKIQLSYLTNQGIPVIQTFTLKSLQFGKPAVVNLPSLTQKEGIHTVFFDGQYVRDPMLFSPQGIWYDPKCLRDNSMLGQVISILQ